MNPIVTLLIMVLRALLPALIQSIGPGTSEDGAQLVGLRDALRDKIRQAWPMAAVLLAVGLGGCMPRTIYVPEGTPVRLRATIPAAAVWVADKDKKPTAGVMDLLEGWYCLSMPAKDGKNGGR